MYRAVATRIYTKKKIKLWGFRVMCISLFFVRILKSLVKHLDNFVLDSNEFVPSTT
jgi:hypothetical protein